MVGADGEDSNATGVNGNQTDNNALSSGAAYVFVRSGNTWTQQAYLKASNTGTGDSFGSSVAVSGDTIVVGAYEEDSNATGVNGYQANNNAGGSGAAYVFVRSGTTWTQQAYLKASNAQGDALSNFGPGDYFGFSVAVSGDTVVVGAYQEYSNATGVNGNQADNSATWSGAAYVFVRPPGGASWTQQAYLKASNTGKKDEFGTSVAVSGDTVVVGAPKESSGTAGINSNQLDNSTYAAGAAYILSRTSTGWSQQAYVKPSSNTLGSENNPVGNLFGSSIAISGNTLVVGSPSEDGVAVGVDGGVWAERKPDSGAAYVFVRRDGVWVPQAYLKAHLPDSGDNFGTSVAVSGDTIVVGAPGEDSVARGVNGNGSDNTATDSGAAYVFTRLPGGTEWTQQAYLKAANSDSGDSFGESVSLSGVTIVVGASNEDSTARGVNGNQTDNNGSNTGAAYVFVRPAGSTTWSQQAYLKASNTGNGDKFGQAVSMSGDTIAIGAALEDSSAVGIDGNQSSNTLPDAGAVYVFSRTSGGTSWAQQAYVKASNTGSRDQFGRSLSIAGDSLVVGAFGEDSNARGVNGNQANNALTDAGAAYVFIRAPGGSTWTQQAYIKSSNPDSRFAGAADSLLADNFGISVATLGDTVVVGAYGESSNATGVNGNQADNSARDSGAAYVFVRSGTAWTQQAYLKASNTGIDDRFGSSVAASGDTVVVGAPREDSIAVGVNGNQADNGATDAGAAYVFLLPLPTPTSPLAAPVTVCSGAPATLSVADPGPGVVIDWFANSCGGTLLGTGNPFNVTPAATTTYFARARNPSSGSTSDACAAVVVTVGRMDYNRDGFLNCDDLCDFITDFYMDPSIPGGLQPVAPTYADINLGYGIGCPGAADAPAPYDTDAYRASGYRVGFSPDGSNACPVSPDQNFPNLDHLADFITEYYAAFTAGGC